VRLTPERLRELERAVETGARVEVYRRGTEFVVVAEALEQRGAEEVLRGRHVHTGEPLTFALSEVERADVVSG